MPPAKKPAANLKPTVHESVANIIVDKVNSMATNRCTARNGTEGDIREVQRIVAETLLKSIK